MPPPEKVTPNELPRLYFELARLGARAEGRNVPWHLGKPSSEETLVLASDASRQDPRLLWVLVDLLARSYDRFHPLLLRRAAMNGRFPGALGVAFEFAKQARPSQELSDMADFVTKRLPRARGESFFIGAHALGGALARREAEESLAEYKRWGYLSREVPVAKELGSSARGHLGAAERMNVLRRVADSRQTFSLADYVAALGGRASLRQASRDLASAPFLKKTGTTRGARYRLTKAP
ncbi:MAG: hypothetical protein ACYDCL_22025 [Myxococcales bacterium]